MQLLGTVLCGFVFAIPIFVVFFIVRSIMKSVERRKAKIQKENTVI